MELIIPKWILVMALFGMETPLSNSPEFNTQSACEIYKHVTLGDTVVNSFRVECARKS